MPEALPAVLIVEDESIVAHDIRHTLASIGYDPFAIASSGEEALARASERCPDLVLMDIRIKGALDGISTARLLQERFGVPVVYLTAHADDTTVDRAKATEPYGYLLKPVKPGELRSAIEIAIFRHKIDKLVRERERWFSTTLRSIADAVITVDLGGRITFMNAAAESLTGWRSADAQGLPAHDVVRLVDEEARETGETPLDRVLQEGTSVVIPEARLRSAANGQTRYIADSAALVVDEGHPLGAVMVFRDVTEQRRLQIQIELADRLVSLGTMAAGLGHEINNPLSVILSGVDLVAAEMERQKGNLRAGIEMPKELREERLDHALRLMARVQSAASRIGTLVAQLRDFARPRSQPAAPANIDRAIDWALWTTSQELRHRARLVVKRGAVPDVRADERKVGQVLVNLLVNAAQAIAPGDVEHNEVTIATRTDERGWAVVEVHDTGSGISPEIMKRLFEPFFTTKPIGIGTGLGLSICHGIVRALGGELTAESRPGEGSVFRVQLPPADAAATGHAPPAPAAHDLPRCRILVVDDQEMILEIFAATLAKHEVVSTTDANEALRLLASGERFDVIFCDLMMPEMTGMELYEEMLRLRPADARRMIFMTGGATTLRAADFLDSVPNRTLPKPFSARALQSVLEEVLATR